MLVDRFVANTVDQVQFTPGLNANGRQYDAALLTLKFRSAAGATLTDKAERLADIISDEAAIEYEKDRDQIFISQAAGWPTKIASQWAM